METRTGQPTHCGASQNAATGRISLANIICLAVFAVAMSVPAAPVAGQSSLPALRAPLLEAPSAPSVLQAKMNLDPNSAGPDINDDEIEELARGLKYDPGLIYKFVHDHIHFDPIWGELKGPYMTWMDRSGTSFDQAALMIALLKHAAQHNTELTITNPKFMVGEIRVDADQIFSWLRLGHTDNDSNMVREVLARAGRYATVVAETYYIPNDPLRREVETTEVNSVNLEHMWVKVTIDGNTYEFDPSFKTHVEKHGLSTADLRNAMGYSEPNFVSDAEDGATTETGFVKSVKDVNQVNIINDLTTYSANLIDYIKTNSPEHQTKDFIGGKVIEPVAESNMPPSLPYTVISRDQEFYIEHIPNLYRTTLRIQHCGIDRTFFSSNIYGRRLTLNYSGSNEPQLILDGEPNAIGSTTTPGQSYDLTLTVDHPYEVSSFDCTTTIKVIADGFYQIVNGWGDTGTHILSKHRSLLQQYQHDGSLDTSEEVLGESYALLGATWLAQTSKMRSLAAETTNHTVFSHHMLGITGQYTAPYIDVPIGHLGIVSFETSPDPTGTFYAIAGHAGAYEHEVIRQLQDRNAVSTVRLIEMANSRTASDKIYWVTSYEWNNTQPYLVNYSQDEKDQVSQYVNAGYTVYLPQYGDLTEEDWTGIGFITSQKTSSLLTAGYIVGGGYSGGYASDGDALLSPSNVLDNSYGAIVDGDAEGAYGFSTGDIAIGGGSWPFGLSFGREYSSHRRFKDGPLGQGWTHNLDITAKVTSDSFQVLGEDSPRDAAIHIVTALVASDIFNSMPDPVSRHVTASLCESWLMDKMIDNVVNIKQGSSVLQFVKRADTPSDPNEKYIAPSGAKLKLVDTGLPQGTTLRLKDSGGTFRDFDTSGRLANWTDAYGNRVDFTYTSGKLTQVASKLKPAAGGDPVTARTLSFTYTGDRITSVSDSASRTISYTYDSNNLTSYTNPDGNAVTYEYDPNEDGLLTDIYSPIAEPNRVVTVVYDSLGRVKQQIDANNCTWDFYRARYRVETLEPNQIDPNGVRQRFSTVTWVNPDNRTTVTTDQLGRQTTTGVEYDGSSRLTKVTYATGVRADGVYHPKDPTDPNSVEWVELIRKPKSGSSESDIVTSSEYKDVYNSDGRYFVVKNRGTSATEENTIYKYDFDTVGDEGVGKLLAIYHPDANTADGLQRLVAKFSYNNDGQIAYVLKMKGEPNEPNEVIIKTSYEYYAASDGAGLKKVIVDSNGVDPLNITTEYAYDSVGRTISVKDPRGNVTQSQYHPSGLLKKTIAPAPFNYETTYEYYEDGRLKYVKHHSPASAGGNNFTSDPHGVALWQFEPTKLTIDSLDTNILTDINSVDESTSDYREGAGAAQLDRSDGEYFSIADAALSSAFPFKNGTSNSKISVCCWVKFNTLTPYPYIFSKSPSGKYGFALGKTNTHKLQLIIGYNSGASAEPLVHDSTVQAGRWYHIGVTFDNTNKSYRVRIWDATAGAILGTDKTGTAVHNVTIDASPFCIGRSAGRTAYNYNLNGRLDEFVVFDDILSTSEIDQIRQGTYGAAPSQTDVYLQYITYNARGQQATVRGPYPEGATQDQMNINYTQYAYDALGRSWKVTDAEGKVTETRYYPDGQVWKVIDPNGDVSLTNVYNPDGTLKETLNAKGNSTTQNYDGFVRPKRVTREDNDTYTERTYDEYGRVETVVHHSNSKDPNDVYTFTYQERSWLKTKVFPDKTVTYKYDVLGRVMETTDNAGTTTNTYDDVGRVTQVDCNDGSGVKTVSYEYDIAGNRTKLTYPDASYITYQYDQLGRLTKIRNQSGTVLAQYTYDALSRRLGLDYANSAYVDYSYDTASRLLYIDNQTGSGQHKYLYTYDDVGNRTIMQVTDSGGTRNHLYTYDNTYQIKDVNYPTGYDYLATDTTFNYDLLGNRTTVVDGGGTTTYLSNVMNQYTKVGAVECLYDPRGNTTYDAGQYMYTYNASNQLVTATKITGSLPAACDTTLSFTTGGNANWLAQTNDANGPDNDAAQSGDISDSQSSWIETTVEGEGTIKFWWKLSSQDGDGVKFAIDSQNQTTRTSDFDWEEGSFAVTGSGTHTLRWTYTKDASGSGSDDCARLDYVRWTGQMPDPNGGFETITYTYDSAGRRIAKAYDSNTVMTYFYDGGHIIAEYDGSGSLLHKYIYGPGVDQPICMIDVEHSNATYYYHFDGLGSVIALTNSAGSVVNLYEYSVYGEVSASDPNHPNRFLFTGREFDADTGLYYYRARYYNPYIGRFLQTDPAGDGMNPYAYCYNNPTGQIDPFGLESGSWRFGEDSEVCSYCGGLWRDHLMGRSYAVDNRVYLDPPRYSEWIRNEGEWWGHWSPDTEYYEWPGRYLIANWRTDREDVEAGAMAWVSLRPKSVVIWDKAAGISRTIVLASLENVEGLVGEGINLIYTTLFSIIQAQITDWLNQVDFGYPYRAFIEVKVYKKRSGFWRHVLGEWNYVGNRVVEVKCGEGWGNYYDLAEGYSSRSEAASAIARALSMLPARPGHPPDRQRR